MSAISIPSSNAAATLPAANIHPHGHGHKKGGGMQADLLTDDSSSTTTAAQVPVGAAQNLFGNILNTLEQVIGVAPAASIASSAANLVSSAAGSAAAPNAAAGAGSKINLMA
jgi:hypothetical protein